MVAEMRLEEVKMIEILSVCSLAFQPPNFDARPAALRAAETRVAILTLLRKPKLTSPK